MASEGLIRAFVPIWPRPRFDSPCVPPRPPSPVPSQLLAVNRNLLGLLAAAVGTGWPSKDPGSDGQRGAAAKRGLVLIGQTFVRAKGALTAYGHYLGTAEAAAEQVPPLLTRTNVAFTNNTAASMDWRRAYA